MTTSDEEEEEDFIVKYGVKMVVEGKCKQSICLNRQLVIVHVSVHLCGATFTPHLKNMFVVLAETEREIRILK